MGGRGREGMGQWGGRDALTMRVGHGWGGRRLGARGGRPVPRLGEHRTPGGGEGVGGAVVRQVAGRTARCLKEVAAKVHCVTGAMVAVVPKAPGVKVLWISFILKKIVWGIFCAKSPVEIHSCFCVLICAGGADCL